MSKHFWILLFGLLSLPGAARAQETPAQKYLLSVERIWDRAPHSAFTDLAEFQGRLYCAFREGAGHVPGKEGNNGAIRILVSADGQNWQSVALLTEDRVDLRDPKLSVTPDDRLMVLMGGSYYEGEKLGVRRTRVSFSNRNATQFSAPRPVEIDSRLRTDADWIWRVTWHRDTGYAVVYQSGGDEFKAHLLSTTDGVQYRLVSSFDLAGQPNETTLRVQPDGTMVAWLRRERGSQNGFLGISRAPYKQWTWKEQSVRLGGPNFLVLPNEKLLGTTRGYLPDGKRTTYVAWIGLDGSLTPLLTLPSGGDTSYAGMLLRGDRVLISYYSSHEGKAAIYLATLNLKALLK